MRRYMENVPRELEYHQHVERMLNTLGVHDIDAIRLVNEALNISSYHWCTYHNDSVSIEEICILSALYASLQGHHICCIDLMKVWNQTCEQEQEEIDEQNRRACEEDEKEA